MKVIIIGGDAAGMSAAMEIVRNKKDAKILVLERGDIYSYGQCGLPYIVDGRIRSTDSLIAREISVFQNKYGIDARIFHEVTSIDTGAQIVRGRHLKTGERFEFQYDKLLIATGASPKIPGWRNYELKGIHTVKSIPQMEYLMKDLERVQYVTVIGGGYIGLEMVEVLKERGLSVRLLHQTESLMNQLHPSLSQKIADEAIKQGIDLCLAEDVVGFNGRERVEEIITKSGHFKTDLVIAATGVAPNTQFATGLAKLENGAIIVNEYMAASVENIYAAGDCATHFNRLKRTDDYIPLGTTANKQGRIAGLNMAGLNVIFKGIVGTSILKFFDLQIGMTGLNDREARALQVDFDSFEWEANNVAGYYPTARPIYLRMLVERKNHKLLGLQAVGTAGVDKRIDVFATALYNEMTFEQLMDLDLAYAPPFNGVWDPVQQVAKRYGKF